MNTPTCCRSLLQEISTTIKSPFDRMIVLGWFDGPTDGIVQCAICGTTYKFRTLTADTGIYEFKSWDEGREIYIFGLAELMSELFEEVVTILSTTEPPQWPIWYRGPYKDYQSKEQYLRADSEANQILERVGDIKLVIAVHMGDFLKEILRSRPVTTEVLAHTTGHDWFSFLQYSKPN